MRKLFDNTKVVVSLDPDTYTADTTGQDFVDTQGYSDAMLQVITGDVTFTTASGEGYTVGLFECDTTNGTYTSTGIEVTANDSNDVDLARITGLNTTRKRYLKAVLDTSATTTSWIGSAAVVLGEPASAPVNSD